MTCAPAGISVDFTYVCGDAYVDQSSFGMAIISRTILSRTAIRWALSSAARLWRDPESVNSIRRAAPGFLVSSGNMDSMVNHYTVNKVPRNRNAYSPGGAPNRARTTPRRCAAAIIRRTHKHTPIILGGVWGNLRRLAHYINGPIRQTLHSVILA